MTALVLTLAALAFVGATTAYLRARAYATVASEERMLAAAMADRAAEAADRAEAVGGRPVHVVVDPPPGLFDQLAANADRAERLGDLPGAGR